jgi:HEAT repeat protein
VRRLHGFLARCALLVGLLLAPTARAEMTDPDQRRQAAAALAERAATGDSDAIAALVPLLHAPDSKVRYHAEHGLAQAGAPAVPALTREFRRLRDDEARARVARAIGHIGLAAGPAMPEMRSALADPDSRAAGPAAYALGAMRAREALPDLVRAYTRSRNIPIQRQLGRAMASIGSDQSLREAKAALVAGVGRNLDAPDWRVRDAALPYVQHLYRAARDDQHGGFPTREELLPLVPGLVRALGDANPEHRLNAMRALTLAGRGAAPAAAALEGQLADPRTRNQALAALRAIDSPEARASITRHEARTALEKRIRSDYAVHDHQGRTRLLPFPVAGSAQDGVRMEARFLYSGKEPRRPAHDRIEWLADARPIPMTDIDRTWSRSRIGVIEQVSATLALEDFLALAQARELRARLGPVEFRLASPDQAALRHFASKIPPPSGPASLGTRLD